MKSSEVIILLVFLGNLSTSLGWVKPGINETFQYQLTGKINTSVNATVFFIDLFENIENKMIQKLKSLNKTVFCYFSAGSYEEWRPDAKSFPKEIIAGDYEGWEGEYWLNIRNFEKTGLADIMRKRMDLAAISGCDGVDPDNINVYENNEDANLDITPQEQILFNTFIANYAHSKNMAVALKNDIDQAKDLIDLFDVAVNESCQTYNECDYLDLFVQRNKAAFGITYYENVPPKKRNWPLICKPQKEKKYSWIIKKLSLEAWIYQC